MKLTKTEWFQFWSELGDDWYHDDSTFPDVEDKNLPEVFEGDSFLAATNPQSDTTGKAWAGLFSSTELREGGAQFSTVFKRWKKRQTTATLLVEVHVDQSAEVMGAVTRLGGKVKRI